MALSEIQNEFLEWLVDERPNKAGGKGTQNQWARSHDIPIATVATWKKQPEFMDAWRIACNDIGVGPQELADVRNAMLGKAKLGDVRAADVWVKLAQKVNPYLFDEPEVIEDKPVDEYSDEELAELLRGI